MGLESKSEGRYLLTREAWESMAHEYADMPIPTPEDNAFFRLFKESYPYDPRKTTVLDIGCGSGQYSIGISKYCKSVVGIDFSSNMINQARKNVERYVVKNVEFFEVDWKNVDLDQKPYSDGFDVVFAHTTPALSSEKAFHKMRAVCNGKCFISLPTRRSDRLLEGALAMIGKAPIPWDTDSRIPILFGKLWDDGLDPLLFYEPDSTWDQTCNVEEAYGYCIRAIEEHDALNPDEKETIRKYVHQQAERGKVHWKTHTNIVTIHWEE